MENTKLKLIYDIKSIPDGWDMDNVFNAMQNGGIVLYDSYNGGDAPKIVEDTDLKLIDVAFIPKSEFKERFEELGIEKDPFFSYKEEDQKD